MLRLLADENFNGDIVRGLMLRQPGLDLVRVQDVGLAGADDSDILAWAAAPLALGESHVEAVVLRAASMGRDIHGPVQQRLVGKHDRRRPHDLAQQRAGVTDRDELLPLCLRKGARDLTREDGRSDQFVDGLLRVGAQLQGLARVGARENPAKGDGSVEDVLHDSSSARSD
jgi:hypothetical protein